MWKGVLVGRNGRSSSPCSSRALLADISGCIVQLPSSATALLRTSHRGLPPTSPLPQVVFEEFGFQAFYAAPATTFSLRRMAQLTPTLPAAAAGAGVVVDAGFSFTHVVPYFEGQPILQAGGARSAQGRGSFTGQPPASRSV